MVDKMTLEQRRKTMQAIKSKSSLEDFVAKELWKRGIRFRRNVKGLFGKPDISIKKYKLVIFVDSCFWHYCPLHGKIPETNREYWEKKLNRNRERDKNVNAYYQEKGWHLIRVWEHEVKDNMGLIIDRIIKTIDGEKNSN